MAIEKKTKWVAILAALLCLAGLIGYYTYANSQANRYNPPTGGEIYAETGTLHRIQDKDYSMDRAEFVRDLTKQETDAFREFLEESEYIELVAYADQVGLPIVTIDGVNWYVYRSSMFRRDADTAKWRKVVNGLELTKADSHSHEIDFAALAKWYELEG